MAEIKEWKHTNGYEVGETLPPVTPEDNGKVLGVSGGAWGVIEQSGGGSEPLIVNIVEEESVWTLDKTWAEIKAAMQSGVVLVSYENEYNSWLSSISYIHDDKNGQYKVYAIYPGGSVEFYASSADGYPSASFD